MTRCASLAKEELLARLFLLRVTLCIGFISLGLELEPTRAALMHFIQLALDTTGPKSEDAYRMVAWAPSVLHGNDACSLLCLQSLLLESQVAAVFRVVQSCHFHRH